MWGASAEYEATLLRGQHHCKVSVATETDSKGGYEATLLRGQHHCWPRLSMVSHRIPPIFRCYAPEQSQIETMFSVAFE